MKLSEQELEKRMTPDNFEKYKRYSTLEDKFSQGKLSDIKTEEWDIVKKILFENNSKILNLPKDIQLSLEVCGHGIEKEREAVEIKNKIKIKLSNLGDAISSLAEDLDKLPQDFVKILDDAAWYVEHLTRINLPDDLKEKVLKHGITSIISKLSDTQNVESLSKKITVLDVDIIRDILRFEIKKLMPEPTEAEILQEVERHFSNGPMGPIR